MSNAILSFGILLNNFATRLFSLFRSKEKSVALDPTAPAPTLTATGAEAAPEPATAPVVAAAAVAVEQPAPAPEAAPEAVAETPAPAAPVAEEPSLLDRAESALGQVVHEVIDKLEEKVVPEATHDLDLLKKLLITLGHDVEARWDNLVEIVKKA